MAVSSLPEPSLASTQEEVNAFKFLSWACEILPFPPRILRSPSGHSARANCVCSVGVGPSAASPCCTTAEAQQTPLPRAGKPRERKMNQLSHTHTSVRGREKSQLSPVLLWHCAENDRGAVTQVELTVTVPPLCTQSLLSYRNMSCPLLSLVSCQSNRFTC